MKTYKHLLNEIFGSLFKKKKEYVVSKYVASEGTKTLSTHDNILDAHREATKHSEKLGNSGFVGVEGKHNGTYTSYRNGKRFR